MKEQAFLEALTKQMESDQNEAKRMFYSAKFGTNFDNPEDLQKLASIIEEYINGIDFVARYYFRKCESWSWYFPHFYAPLLSDVLICLADKLSTSQAVTKLPLSEPFPPFKQLLAIIPRRSHILLPKCLQPLFTDPDSLLLRNNYLPEQYALDSYGCCQEY
jgi:5'-3' exonuclease